jgi:hypothetical protein
MKRKKRIDKKIATKYQLCGCCLHPLGFQIGSVRNYQCNHCGHTFQSASKESPNLLPTVGDKLYMFDDGKLSPSRLTYAYVKNVFKRSEAPREWITMLKVDRSYWLNYKRSKYFIELEFDDDKSTFIASQDLWGNFYGIDENYRVDICGKYMKWCCERFDITESEALERAELT